LDMKTWLRCADATFVDSDFWDLEIPKKGEGILRAFRNKLSRSQAPPNTPADVRRTLTVAHAETALASAVLLHSPQEYMDWMEVYVKRLAEDNAQNKLREVFETLLARNPAVDRHPVLTPVQKRETLGRLLETAPLRSEKLKLLVTEYRELVQLVDDEEPCLW